MSASVLGFRRPVLRRRHRSPIVHAFELYSEEHGEGTPVVFAHGAGGTHMTWWNQIPTFLREFRCVTYPQHGFGFSPVVSGGLGRGAFVEDLRGLLDRLEFERVSLVGQSMGGRSVLRFAAAYPERVEALVMSSTTAGYQDDDLARLRESVPGLGVRSPFSAAYAERDPEGAFRYRVVQRINRRLSADDTDPTDTPNTGYRMNYRCGRQNDVHRRRVRYRGARDRHQRYAGQDDRFDTHDV